MEKLKISLLKNQQLLVQNGFNTVRFVECSDMVSNIRDENGSWISILMK